ncbi:o-succinylbenzoate--CoA ligase [Vibrio japonicus]|uniref:O-succinylbenzoate--CoA ligase n=1 Tax=Vibrio japonicus TaxID=1824638 RepID=A0ABY5LK23_9VIBR|nr:o-succinylbenzoate--CoA ligase [Vibrio japonicus]UUM31452.1 o-succinylbenzoate--CoA ligase [Vibrio japonicus]
MTEQNSLPNKWAQQSPSLLALSTPEADYTWRQLKEKIDRVVASLIAQGIQKNDVLTCVGKNSPELLFTYLACLEIGAICALTMPQTERELKLKLDALYADPNDRKLWLAQSYESLNTYVTINDSDAHSSISKHDYDESNLASIIFTSGSMGAPKAVAHTSKQHLASASGLLQQFHFKQGDTWLLSLPMYHVSGLSIIYRWLYAGATLKIGTGNLLDDINGVSHASLVATQLKRLIECDQPLALTHVLLGGSHIPLELSQRAAEQGIETWLGYGMTEAASTVTAKPIDQHYSAGKVLPNRQVMLKGQRIYIGGETLASGYYCKGTLMPLREGGWFDSKDLGEWVEGELKIIGRADNLFISGGENIHCEEIEAELNKHPEIIQSVVVPIADVEFGHRPVAVIQTRIDLTQSEIESTLGGLTRFKWPDAYYSMPEALLADGIKVPRSRVKQWLETKLS